MVGFQKRQCEQLAAQKDLQQPVELANCVIQKELHGDRMEVVVSGSTKITSPRKYQPLASRKPMDESKVNEIKDKQDGQHASVVVKVLKIAEKEEVFKQDVTIADKSGTIRLTLWQNDINQMQVGKSYTLDYVTVKSFNNVKYLSSPRVGFTVTVVDDIGEVKPLEERVATTM